MELISFVARRHVTLLIIASLFACAAIALAESKAPASSPSTDRIIGLSLFVQSFQVSPHSEVPIVISVENSSRGSIQIFDYVSLARPSDTLGSNPNAPVPGRDKSLGTIKSILLICIADGSPNPVNAREIRQPVSALTILEGKEHIAKVVIAGSLFTQGKVTLVAEARDGAKVIARSNSIEISVVP